MIDSLASKKRSTIDAISQITTKILDRFRRKEIIVAIFYIEKAYNKVNREKKLDNMGIQGKMMAFIRELISKRWVKVRVEGSISQSKHTDLGIPKKGVLSVTLFLVAINGILGELGNGVDGSLFAHDLTIYITTRSQRVAFRALQGVTNKLEAWAAERDLTFSPKQ